jgi:hypothetical protein
MPFRFRGELIGKRREMQAEPCVVGWLGSRDHLPDFQGIQKTRQFIL